MIIYRLLRYDEIIQSFYNLLLHSPFYYLEGTYACRCSLHFILGFTIYLKFLVGFSFLENRAFGKMMINESF